MKKNKILLAIGSYIDDFFYVAGTAVVSYGAFLIYKPAGYITAGFLMVFYALMISIARRRR